MLLHLDNVLENENRTKKRKVRRGHRGTEAAQRAAQWHGHVTVLYTTQCHKLADSNDAEREINNHYRKKAEHWVETNTNNQPKT